MREAQDVIRSRGWLPGVLAGLILAFGYHAVAHAADCASQNLSQLELNQCADQDAKQADTALNAVYAKLRQKIDPKNQTQLRDAQRAWIAFRDQECVFRTGGGMNQEGTIWPMLVLQCHAELTKARTEELQKQLKCPSWDLSCPAGE